MLSNDVIMVAVWAVAGFSLVIQIYLFLTWPAAKEAPEAAEGLAVSPEGKLPAPPWAAEATRDAPEPRRQPTWEAPSEAALDGILADRPAAPMAGAALPRRPQRGRPAVPMQHRLVRAGIYRKGSMRTFARIRVGITLSFAVASSGLAMLLGLGPDFLLYFAATGALAGYLLPSFWLDSQLRSRQTRMRRALPDALDLVTVCVQGGLSLPAALARVARELGPAHPMLATELSIVEREIQMGRTTGSALFQLAERFHLEELRSLSSLVGQTEKYGGSVSGALRTYADTLRTKRRQRAEELAQKAAVKLLFPTLICIFPGIFVVVLGPTAMRMMEVMQEVSWGG